jgi:hypothetical protein
MIAFRSRLASSRICTGNALSSLHRDWRIRLAPVSPHERAETWAASNSVSNSSLLNGRAFTSVERAVQ